MTVKRLSRAGGLVAGKEESSIKRSGAESFYDCSVGVVEAGTHCRLAHVAKTRSGM